MGKDALIILDAGHGGFRPGTCEYTTAPAKQWRHKKDTFHQDGWFFEGVFNRQIVDRVAAKLRQLGLRHLVVSHSWIDTPLEERVESANYYYRHFSDAVFVSSHANASGTGKARGYEIFTSPGKTKSDQLASFIWKHTEHLLGRSIHYRSDRSDGDPDKEAHFYVLTRTHMPAVLIEHLFFDNYEDAKLLMEENIQDLFAEAQVRGIIDFLN